MDFNSDNYQAKLAAMEALVAADTSDWRSTLVLRYTRFLTTQLNQRQANLDALMARTGLTDDVAAKRQAFYDTEQPAINAIRVQIASVLTVQAMITDPVATEAMLRIYSQAGGM